MPRLTPLWLGDLLAAVMIATAVYCVGRIAYARVRNRSTYRDADGLHVLMGVAMAGMLSTHLAALAPLSGALHTIWLTVFALGTAWFGYRAVTYRAVASRPVANRATRDQSRVACGESGPLIHVFGSAAMLYMFAAAGSGGAMAGMPIPGSDTSSGSVRLPEVGVLLAVLATGAAVLVLDRLAATAAAGTGTIAGPVAVGLPAASLGARPVTRRILAPRAAECCHLVMCVTTAYMLIAMFA
jgi:hypothetical protein